MASSSPQEVTQLLVAWSEGNAEALAQLVPLVEAELDRLAHGYLRDFASEQTLQTTALVNEAYVRLIEWQNVTWQNRAQFIGMAATIMKNLLIDRARRRKALKHGGGMLRVSLPHATLEPHQFDPDILALNDALNELAKLDERQSRIVELSFFGGLNNEEIAHLLGVGERTVRRDWNMARAWLFRELTKISPPPQADDSCHEL